ENSNASVNSATSEQSPLIPRIFVAAKQSVTIQRCERSELPRVFTHPGKREPGRLIEQRHLRAQTLRALAPRLREDDSHVELR
ncbi:MAG TPA: hypothetical protein VII49_11300, partial [Rhizomicrobium sp.]